MILLFSTCNGDPNMIGISSTIERLGEEEMIFTREHKTAYIFDPWHFLGQKRRRLMDESWAAVRKARSAGQEPADAGRLPIQPVISVIKEHVASVRGLVKLILSPFACPNQAAHAHFAS